MTGACMKKNRNFVPKNSLTGTASNMAADFYRNKKEPCTPGHCRWMDTILFRYKNVFKIWRTPFSQKGAQVSFAAAMTSALALATA